MSLENTVSREQDDRGRERREEANPLWKRSVSWWTWGQEITKTLKRAFTSFPLAAPCCRSSRKNHKGSVFLSLAGVSSYMEMIVSVKTGLFWLIGCICYLRSEYCLTRKLFYCMLMSPNPIIPVTQKPYAFILIWLCRKHNKLLQAFTDATLEQQFSTRKLLVRSLGLTVY